MTAFNSKGCRGTIAASCTLCIPKNLFPYDDRGVFVARIHHSYVLVRMEHSVGPNRSKQDLREPHHH